MHSILIFGAYGLLGSSLCDALQQAGFRVFRQGRQASAEIPLDPLDLKALRSALAATRPDTVINLIAATNVDQCEADMTMAYLANARVVERLAQGISACPGEKRPHLVQISTDHVYDGPGPHAEQNVAPCNAYALSKLAGELAAGLVGATVLRTCFIGRSHCPGRVSLTDWIVNSLRAGQRITVFEDIHFSALHTSTLCKALGLVARNPKPGVFNLGCCDGDSKAHLAYALAAHLGLDPDLLAKGLARDAAQLTRRPPDMRMDSSLFSQTFHFTCPTLDSQIALAAQEY